jgi:type II secretory pathway pseudopilin PulG
MSAKRVAVAILAGMLSSAALAKLPPLNDDQKAKAAEAKAKADWQAKVDAYQLCVSQERVARFYDASLKAKDKPVPQPVATAPCQDPGPFQAASAAK